ncbi:MAG: NUDIX domain-containing protein [Clostridia bacterium]|jgi:isopentenyldiphosphate isomerase|nr:NUDIX domain-containing protein [Clostridia bacterium]
MEYLDLVNKVGEKTGEVKDRKEIHSKGYWHRGFHIWVINSNQELLLQRRSENKDVYPNKLYASVAGHMTSGEKEIEGIVRECSEEINYTVNKEDLEYLFTFSQEVVENQGKFLDNMFYDVYLLEKDIDISTLKLQKEEVKDIQYIDFREYEKMVNNHHKDIVNHPEEWEKLFRILHKKYDRQ